MFFTKKIKVGFGPITTGEDNFDVRKWRIDPVVNEINKTSSRYIAGIFFEPEEMKNFDVIIIVKNFNPDFIEIICKLKEKGKKFIYDIVDNPNCALPYQYYYAEMPQFLELLDGFILSSPLQEARIKKYSEHYSLIEHPIISSIYKKEY